MIRVLLATLVLVYAAGVATAQVQPGADPRDRLRYDGKSFSYWQAYLQSELKQERRVDALRAMAEFGTRGYAKEAASAVVELLQDYDNNEMALLFCNITRPTTKRRTSRCCAKRRK